MKNRILVTLPLAAVLAFPALAQTSSDQTQATTPSTTQSTENATGKQPLQAPAREGFWGRVNPFARKNYVKRQTDPIRDRVNELDDLTATNGKAIKDTDSRAQAGIQLASNKADMADQHAVDAGNKATMAQQSAQQASVSEIQFWAFGDGLRPVREPWLQQHDLTGSFQHRQPIIRC